MSTADKKMAAPLTTEEKAAQASLPGLGDAEVQSPAENAPDAQESGPAGIPDDVLAPDTASRDYVTVVTTDRPCGKSASLVDGVLKVESLGNVIEGVAITHHVPTAESMAALLTGLTDHQYVIGDFIEAARDGRPFRIINATRFSMLFPGVTPSGVHERDDYRFAALAPNVWTFGSWKLADRDIDAQTPRRLVDLTADEFVAEVDRLLPGFARAPRVVLPSAKARVRAVGGEAASRPNLHIWFKVSDPENTNISRGKVKINAEAAGLGWSCPKRSRDTGKELASKVRKAIIDVMCWTDHRIVYDGAPSIVGEGVELAPVTVTFVEGVPLRFANIPIPTEAAISKVERITGTRARVTPAGRLDLVDNKSLKLSTEVELEDGRVMTIAEFLHDTSIENEEKVRCQAIFRDSTSMNGILRKWADGRVWHYDNGAEISYYLSEVDWRWVISTADGDEDLIAVALARMTDLQWQKERKAVQQTLGLPTLKAADLLRIAGRNAPPPHDDFIEAKIAAEEVEMEQAIFVAGQTEPKRVAECSSGIEIYIQLLTHYHYLLKSQGTEALRFRTKQSMELTLEGFALSPLADYASNKPYITPDGSELNPVKMWVTASNRKSVEEIAFEPGLAMPVGCLNLWQGFDVKPGDPDGCKLFIAHIREVVAAGDPVVAEYLLNWFAYVVQQVTRRNGKRFQKAGVAIVLRGKQGTGKSIVGEYFARLFGHHAHVTASGERVGAQFNWELANKLFLCADEAAFSGDRKLFSMLKAFITDRTFEYEKKFADTMRLNNYINMMMTTNDDWAVPADVEDRRFCVLDVPTTRKGDRPYFDALLAEMNGDGPGALLAWLSQRDITGFRPQNYPKTAALADQKLLTMQSKDIVMHWLYQSLQDGAFDFAGMTDFPESAHPVWGDLGDGRTSVDRYMLEGKLIQMTKDNKQWSPPSRDTIGRKLREVFGDLMKTNKPHAGPRRWVLPSLSVARAAFELHLGRKIDWEVVLEPEIVEF